MNRRSVIAGLIGAAAMTLFYAVVVAGASGSLAHLTEQARADWYFLILIVAGFGTQIGLMAELRRRHRLHHGAAVVGGAGAGASSAGMVACCAHHIADLAPFVGATGAASFLTDYRVAAMVLGIAVNGIGVTLAAFRLRRTAIVEQSEHDERSDLCAAA